MANQNSPPRGRVSHPKAPYHFGGGGDTIVEGGLPQRKEMLVELVLDGINEVRGYVELTAESGIDLLQISASLPGRLVLYASQEDMDADDLRDEDVLPATPVLLDITMGYDETNSSIRLFDQAVEGLHMYNRDDPATKKLYYKLQIDPDIFLDGIPTFNFSRGGGGPPANQQDQGSCAKHKYGLSYTQQPGEISAPGPGGWCDIPSFIYDSGFYSDNYGWYGGGGGLRARQNGGYGTSSFCTTSIARFPFWNPTGDSITQIFTVKHDKSFHPSDWVAGFARSMYFCQNDSPRSTLECGVSTHNLDNVQAKIAWTDAAGTTLTLATVATDFDVGSGYRKVQSAVIGGYAFLWIDGVLILGPVAVPPVLLSSPHRGIGLCMSNSNMVFPVRGYTGLEVGRWGFLEGDIGRYQLGLGYVPTEVPGGSISNVLPEILPP